MSASTATTPISETSPAEHPVEHPVEHPSAGTTSNEGVADCAAESHGYSDHKDALLKRLRRAEGQVRGVHRMVEEDKYCIDILTQVSAATKALERVALALLDDHLSHCVVTAAREGGPEGEAKLKEASQAIARLVG